MGLMVDLKTHSDVIGLWPNAAEFARAIATSESNARNMRSKGAIPPHLYQAVADAAVRAGWEGVTYARLTELGRART